MVLCSTALEVMTDDENFNRLLRAAPNISIMYDMKGIL
jgi:hypothetical protein